MSPAEPHRAGFAVAEAVVEVSPSVTRFGGDSTPRPRQPPSRVGEDAGSVVAARCDASPPSCPARRSSWVTGAGVWPITFASAPKCEGAREIRDPRRVPSDALLRGRDAKDVAVRQLSSRVLRRHVVERSAGPRRLGDRRAVGVAAEHRCHASRKGGRLSPTMVHLDPATFPQCLAGMADEHRVVPAVTTRCTCNEHGSQSRPARGDASGGGSPSAPDRSNADGRSSAENRRWRRARRRPRPEHLAGAAGRGRARSAPRRHTETAGRADVDERARDHRPPTATGATGITRGTPMTASSPSTGAPPTKPPFQPFMDAAEKRRTTGPGPPTQWEKSAVGSSGLGSTGGRLATQLLRFRHESPVRARRAFGPGITPTRESARRQLRNVRVRRSPHPVPRASPARSSGRPRSARRSTARRSSRCCSSRS